MSTTLQSDIAAVRQQIEAATAKLRELEKKAAEPPAPWQPKGGEYVVGLDGDVFAVPTILSVHTMAGSRYPTPDAARSAVPYVTFFKRMCCLAQELNPSGKVGGVFNICCGIRGWFTYGNSGMKDQNNLFETYESAEKAAAILNRDGVKPPTSN